MKTKLIYALSALTMIAALLTTSCKEDAPVEPKPKEYTVTFDANGGQGTMENQVAKEKKEVALAANTFTRTDHTFSTWNTKANGTGESYADEASVTLEADLTLYAQWIENAAPTHQVTFDANGGEGTMKAQVIEENVETALTANAFTRTYNKFTAWNTKADGSGTSYDNGASVTIAAGITLYAQWELTHYTITFDPNGGTGTMEMQAGEITAGGSATINTTENSFVRTGYRFIHWNTKADNSGYSYANKVALGIRENTTLYAQWAFGEATFCTVTFDPNGGEGTMEKQEVEENQLTDLNANTFTRNNYSFVCWNTKADGSGEEYADEKWSSITEDITLYAQWAAISSTDLLLADIDATNPPEGDVWTIADTDATAADADKFAGLRAAIKALDASRSVDVIFPNLRTLPNEALKGCEATANWTFSAHNVVEVKMAVFAEVGQLKEINLPKATKFGAKLTNSTALTTLTIATEERVSKLVTIVFNYMTTANIDLITHQSNVEGLTFNFTSGSPSDYSTPFKSVNGAVPAGIPINSQIVTGNKESKNLFLYDEVMTIVTDEDEEELYGTVFYVGYKMSTLSAYIKFEEVTWSSSEDGTDDYIELHDIKNGGVYLEVIKTYTDTFPKTITITATAPNGSTKSFEVQLYRKMTVIVP